MPDHTRRQQRLRAICSSSAQSNGGSDFSALSIRAFTEAEKRGSLTETILADERVTDFLTCVLIAIEPSLFAVRTNERRSG